MILIAHLFSKGTAARWLIIDGKNFESVNHYINYCKYYGKPKLVGESLEAHNKLAESFLEGGYYGVQHFWNINEDQNGNLWGGYDEGLFCMLNSTRFSLKTHQ